MQFRAQGTELLDGFQLAASVVGPKATRDVTRNTKLVARHTDAGPQVGIYAVGDETSLQYRLTPFEVEKEGEIVLPSETMVGVLREVRNQEVSLNVRDLSCEVSMGQSFFRVLGEDESGFPDEMQFDAARAISMPAGDLASMLSRILFACSTEDARYAMNGVLFSLEDGSIELVATDGRRLAFVEGKVPESQKGAPVIVPRVSIQHALKMLSGADDQMVRLSMDEHQFALETERGVLFSRLIDGKFPPHKDVIRPKVSFSVPFGRHDLLTAVRQAALLTDPASKSVKFTFAGGELEISSRTADKGEARIKLPVEYDGDDFVIHFNPDYIAECLKVLEEDRIEFRFTDSSRQAVISDERGFLYIIMPVTPSGA